MKIENLSFKQVLAGLVLMIVLMTIAADQSRLAMISKLDSIINPLQEVECASC